jgi:hypothetical protein
MKCAHLAQKRVLHATNAFFNSIFFQILVSLVATISGAITFDTMTVLQHHTIVSLNA